MRRCFYHTDLRQNAVLHNFSTQITLIQYSGPSNHAWAFNETVKKFPKSPIRPAGSEKHLSSLLVFLPNWLNFCVRGQFEPKMLIVRGHSDINTTYFIWIFKVIKNKLEPAIIWKLVTCQRITSKNTRPGWVRWYWSADTLFSQVPTLLCNQFSPGPPGLPK